MKKMNFNIYNLLFRISVCLLCWCFDSLFYILGFGLNVKTILIVIYRWCLYKSSDFDLKIFFFTGFLYDFVHIVPLGLHGLLFSLIYLIGENQSRYLKTSYEYIKWFVFLVFLIIFFQIESIIMFLADKFLVFNKSIFFSILVCFAVYPFVFRFLQRYD